MDNVKMTLAEDYLFVLPFELRDEFIELADLRNYFIADFHLNAPFKKSLQTFSYLSGESIAQR